MDPARENGLTKKESGQNHEKGGFAVTRKEKLRRVLARIFIIDDDALPVL